MSMKIDDWEYHSRMLADIAKRNGASLVMCYDPNPDKPTGKHALAIVGNGVHVIGMMATIITESAKITGVDPCMLSGEIREWIKAFCTFEENSK